MQDGSDEHGGRLVNSKRIPLIFLQNWYTGEEHTDSGFFTVVMITAPSVNLLAVWLLIGGI